MIYVFGVGFRGGDQKKAFYYCQTFCQFLLLMIIDGQNIHLKQKCTQKSHYSYACMFKQT